MMTGSEFNNSLKDFHLTHKILAYTVLRDACHLTLLLDLGLVNATAVAGGEEKMFGGNRDDSLARNAVVNGRLLALLVILFLFSPGVIWLPWAMFMCWCFKAGFSCLCMDLFFGPLPSPFNGPFTAIFRVAGESAYVLRIFLSCGT